MPAPIDQHYGPYRVIRLLGGGGMGTVLLAEDSRLGRLVALKTIPGDEAPTAAARGRLLHEARAAARLTHPSIAAVHDVLDIGGETVIVFEYVEGETLASRLLRGRLSVTDALRIGEQLADGLAAAHAQGIVHRDLKPANVMLMLDGRAKILDFGIAHRAVDNEETSAALVSAVGMYSGTPAYAAPEQWLGEPIGAHTDIFALGLLLFEMLGGRLPFESKSRLALMHQVIEAPRPHIRELNPSVPPSVDALIASALSREPSQRPASAREIASVLRSIVHDVSDRQPARRSASAAVIRWTLVAAAALIVFLAVLISTLGGPSAVRGVDSTPVVAVLPLTNSTGSATNDYLAAGLGDSLTTSLASLRGVTVVSRAAVLGVWTQETDPSKVARELGASFLVEGSVQRAGDRIRLTVNLVRPDRSVAWAESVEGAFDRVFELQSRLAAALGRALSVHVSAPERARLAQQPTSNPDALAAYWRGRALLDRRDVKGNVDAALVAFDSATRLDPDFAVAHAARGEALWRRYLDTRDVVMAQQAIGAATTALRLDPDSAAVRYTLAVTLAGSGRVDEAIDELERALALQPNHDEARRQLADVLAGKGRLDEAIGEYRKAIELRPNYWGHHSALGTSLFRAARYDEAAEAFTRALELQPDNALLYQQLGTVYQALGRMDEALAKYERSIQLRPSPEVYSNQGALHHARGEYAKAVDAYQKAIALRPHYPIAYRNMGDSYAKLRRRADARRAYLEAVRLTEESLEINSTDAVERARLGVYLAKAGEHRRAGVEIEQALRLAPNNMQVLVRGAVVYALSGDQPRALDVLEKAMAAGYSRAAARSEEDFEALKQSARFQALAADNAPVKGSPR